MHAMVMQMAADDRARDMQAAAAAARLARQARRAGHGRAAGPGQAVQAGRAGRLRRVLGQPGRLASAVKI